MNEFTAVVLFIALQYGAAVLLLPYVVSLLGAVPFTFILFSSISFYTYCGVLGEKAFMRVLRTTDDTVGEMLRRPLKMFVSAAFGKCMGEFAVVLQLLNLACVAIGIGILCGTTLQFILPIEQFERVDQIRIWIAIMYFVLILPSLYGTYNELGIISYVAFGSILFCEVCIILGSIVVYCLNVVPLDRVQLPSDTQSTYEILISSIGTLSLVTVGLFLVLPNVAVLIQDVEKLQSSILFSNAVLFLLFLVNGLTPYFLLAEHQIEPSVLSTITRISNASGNATLKAIILLIQISSICHFMTVEIMLLNPLYLYVEEKLNISKEFGWQRVLSRCVVLALVLSVCILIPSFGPMLSWIGGVPSLVFSTILPMALYFKLFPKASMWMKCFSVILAGVIVALALNVNFVDLYILIKSDIL